MKIKDLKIGTRLGVAFAAVLTLTVGMTAIGISELSRIFDAKMEMKQSAREHALADKWLEGTATNTVRTLAKAKSSNAADQHYFEDEMKAVSKRITEISKELEQLIVSDEGKRLFADVTAKRKIYIDVRDSIFTMKKAAEVNEAEIKAAIDGKLLPVMKTYVASIQTVADYEEALFNKANDRIDEVYAEARMLLVALGLAALALGAAMAWALSRSITRLLTIAQN